MDFITWVNIPYEGCEWLNWKYPVKRGSQGNKRKFMIYDLWYKKGSLCLHMPYKLDLNFAYIIRL